MNGHLARVLAILVGLAAAGGGLLLRLLLRGNLHDSTPYLTFVPFVLLASAVRGWLAGLSATVASVVLVYVYLPATVPTAAWIGFLLVGALISWNQERLSSAKRQAVRSQHLLQTTLTGIGDAVVHLNPAGMIVYGNRAAEKLLGLPLPAKLLLLDEATAEERPPRNGTFLLEGKTPVAVTVGDSEGDTVVVLRPIAVERAAARALEKSEERLRLALDAGKIGVWDWNLREDRIEWSDRIYEIHGVPASEPPLTMEKYRATIHPDDLAHVSAAVERALRGEDAYSEEFRIVRPNQEIRWVQTSAQVFFSNGAAVRMLGATTDITDRRAIEERLRESEAGLQMAARAARLGFWDWDLVTNQVRRSEGFYELLGLSPDCQDQSVELLERAMVAPEDWTRRSEAVEKARRDGTEYRAEFQITRPDGSKHWLHSRGNFTYNAQGEAIRMRGIVLDITDRKESEEALARSEKIYRAIGESIPFGIWICDREGRNTYASESLLQLTGMTQAECSEFGWERALDPGRAAEVIAKWKECVRTGGTWDEEFSYVGTDGKLYPMLVRGVPVRDAKGDVECWAGINMDIRRMKEAEAELRQQAVDLRRANDELEEFASFLSHDLREPLRTVNIYSTLLLRKAGEPPGLQQYAGFITTAVQRMEKLIGDVLTYSRSAYGTNPGVPIQAAEALEDALQLCRATIEESGACIDCSRESLRVIADRGQLALVFQNLISNAVKYRDANRPVRIRIGAEEREREAVFWVADNGIGFDNKDAMLLFRSFHRLQASAEPGTGLGLAICRKIVERFHGRIWADGEPGQGATFYFTLPLAD